MALGRVGDAGRGGTARPARTPGVRRRVPLRRGIVVFGALALVAGLMTPAAAYPRPGSTERVSVASDGTEGNNRSHFAAISADGRYVAFQSSASNLVPGDTNGVTDVFVHDRQTGTTERVSVASDGAQANGHSADPAISADGRHVAFESIASNLVPEDTNNAPDIFVHDRETRTTERVSVGSDGTQGNYESLAPAISADGRHVVFFSFASNLVPGDTIGAWDVFVHDRQTGTTERVSVASDGARGDGHSVDPAISADGRHVAFVSLASNLVPGDTNGAWDVFVHDRQTGTTERVSVASDGAQGNGRSTYPAISADGRHVAFVSVASNLVPGDTNGGVVLSGALDWDVFVYDRQTGTTERVSVASDGTEANGSSEFTPAISADGRHIAFASLASNLVPGDDNSRQDVFVHDREMGVTERVSVASDGAQAYGTAYPTISADGRHVAFFSTASNLVPADTNDAYDVFVRDRGPATGVGSLETQGAGEEFTVSGWATFSGMIMTSADDPADDGVEPLGAEVTAASVIYRPEQEDLLLRMDLMSLPGPVGSCIGGACVSARPGGGAPGVLYRWAFTIGETAYEARALRAAATSDPSTAEPYFALYECTPQCTETAPLSGGIGTIGTDVRVAVPLEALGVEEGTALTDVEASAALGEAAPGPLVVLDDVALPDASIPASRVELGIAPPSAPQADVVFSAQAELVEGRFSATLDASSLPPGAHRVWARACLGETCGAEWVDVAL